MGVFDGATQRRPAFTADPDGDRVLHRLRLEHHIVEPDVLAGKLGKVGSPEFLARIHPFVSHLPAFVERGRGNGLELFPAPTDADADREVAFGQESMVDKNFAVSTAGRCGTTMTDSTKRSLSVNAAI
jgi:hypothetical protein